MKLIFASQNQHKRKELAQLLLPHEIIMPETFFFEETADTFTGNALGKAEHLFAQVGVPTIADDSGIIIDALDGAPGVLSARYGMDAQGRELSAPEKNLLVLEQLQQVQKADRSARFVCSMALVLSPYRKFVVQETVEGFIAAKPYGAGGFGYDPIFLVGTTETTMAQLSAQQKNAISHRSMAARRILTLIAQIEQSEVLHVC